MLSFSGDCNNAHRVAIFLHSITFTLHNYVCVSAMATTVIFSIAVIPSPESGGVATKNYHFVTELLQRNKGYSLTVDRNNLWKGRI